MSGCCKMLTTKDRKFSIVSDVLPLTHSFIFFFKLEDSECLLKEMALISSNTFLGWNVKKGVLLASPGEGSLTQHHTMCWSVIRMEGESCCQHKLWGHLLYGIKGSREGPAVSLGLVVCASCYLGPDPKCSLLLQCFPPQLCSNQSLGSVSQVTDDDSAIYEPSVR